MAKPENPLPIEAVRRFNRFYTRQIGVLHEKLLRSPFSLAEARVIYELAHQEKTTATLLGSEIGLDAGYLSRILRSFEKRGLIERQTSDTDGRQSNLWLTEPGKEAFAVINARSHHEIEELLGGLFPWLIGVAAEGLGLHLAMWLLLLGPLSLIFFLPHHAKHGAAGKE